MFPLLRWTSADAYKYKTHLGGGIHLWFNNWTSKSGLRGKETGFPVEGKTDILITICRFCQRQTLKVILCSALFESKVEKTTTITPSGSIILNHWSFASLGLWLRCCFYCKLFNFDGMFLYFWNPEQQTCSLVWSISTINIFQLCVLSSSSSKFTSLQSYPKKFI